MMSKEAMKRTVDRIKSTFWEGYLPEPDKRQQALDKMAENARELGLDYEQPTYKFHITPQQDPEWKCYLFGNKPETGSYGIVYIPSVGNVPNWFIRWMMKVCLGCTWVREQK
jgi:hypothetical protein